MGKGVATPHHHNKPGKPYRRRGGGCYKRIAIQVIPAVDDLSIDGGPQTVHQDQMGFEAFLAGISQEQDVAIIKFVIQHIDILLIRTTDGCTLTSHQHLWYLVPGGIERDVKVILNRSGERKVSSGITIEENTTMAGVYRVS